MLLYICYISQLKDLNIAQQIADSLQIDKPTKVLEVGPGMGVLTQFLLQNKNIDLKVIEIDKESVDYLLVHFPQLQNRIISGDFLRINLSELYPGNFCVIGNFPYNISSQIFS